MKRTKQKTFIFAALLTMRTSIFVLIAAAIFMPYYKGDSLGCCYQSGSRCMALLTFSKLDSNSLFYSSNLTRQMRTSVKASAPAINEQLFNMFPNGNNPNLYLVSIFKAFYEFVQEETQGDSLSKLRLNNRIDAARMLFSSDKKDLCRKGGLV
jgi:hypothetical protein